MTRIKMHERKLDISGLLNRNEKFARIFTLYMKGNYNYFAERTSPAIISRSLFPCFQSFIALVLNIFEFQERMN